MKLECCPTDAPSSSCADTQEQVVRWLQKYEFYSKPAVGSQPVHHYRASTNHMWPRGHEMRSTTSSVWPCTSLKYLRMVHIRHLARRTKLPSLLYARSTDCVPWPPHQHPQHILCFHLPTTRALQHPQSYQAIASICDRVNVNTNCVLNMFPMGSGRFKDKSTGSIHLQNQISHSTSSSLQCWITSNPCPPWRNHWLAVLWDNYPSVTLTRRELFGNVVW